MTGLIPDYRQWRRAMRRGRCLSNEADRRCGELTVPPALIRLPDYAGGGVVSRADTIRECGGLTDEDRAALLAEFERLEAAVLEAEQAAGIIDLTDEAHRLWLEESALAAQILAAPARSLPELHAKAQVGLAYAESWTPNTDPEKALHSLRRDLGALMGEARKAPHLTKLHAEWCGVRDWLDHWYNLGGYRSETKRAFRRNRKRLDELETAIAKAPATGLLATVIKLDVGAGEYAASILDGGGDVLEILDEGAFLASVSALEALCAQVPGFTCWTLEARRRGLQRLAERRAAKEAA